MSGILDYLAEKDFRRDLGYKAGSVSNLKVVGGGTATIGGTPMFALDNHGGSGTLEVSDGGVVNVGQEVVLQCNSSSA